MSKFKERFAINPEVGENGQWVDFGDGIQVQVRRYSSKSVQELHRTLERPYAKIQKQNVNFEIPADVREKNIIKLLCDIIVVNWKGVTDIQSGEPLECTLENKKKIFEDTHLEDFRNQVFFASASSETFRDMEEFTKEAVKN